MLLQQEKKLREPGLFGKFFGGSSNKPDAKKEQKMIKPRKAPIKVEPKVFFANERTFLAWMHISIILAGASIAILAFSDYDNIGKQIYGLITLPVAIAFIVYSMYQCKYSPTLKIHGAIWILLLRWASSILIFLRFSSVGESFLLLFGVNADVRRAYMIKNKLPGPYDDTVGPTVLGIMLMISITAQFAIKLMAMTK